MIPIKFNKSLGANGAFTRTEETDAFVAFEKFGFTFVVHEEDEGDFIAWEISELSTGFRVNFDTPAYEAQEAIDRASKFLDEKGEQLTSQVIQDAKMMLALVEAVTKKLDRDNVPYTKPE